ncbi:hypothetical protein [Rhizobium tropici]|uniref:hypothetical protein n=1 Tax=Rhizobium tropici TaxID=398 RepID=UPI001FEE03A3|nr:hypothetical protein [Rhizobium tropici]
MASKDRSLEVGEREIRLAKQGANLLKGRTADIADVMLYERLARYGQCEPVIHVSPFVAATAANFRKPMLRRAATLSR